MPPQLEMIKRSLAPVDKVPSLSYFFADLSFSHLTSHLSYNSAISLQIARLCCSKSVLLVVFLLYFSYYLMIWARR